MRERYGLFAEAWDDLVFEPLEFIGGDGVVVAVVAMRGTGKASGAPLDTEVAYVYDVRSGRIVRDRPFESRRKALEAGGLSE